LIRWGTAASLIHQIRKLQRLLIDDELDGEDVIKGFKLKVKRLFDLPNIGQPDDFN
jgi:hypothetical protein